MNNYYCQVIKNPKIIDILDEIAQEKLSEGATFEYNGEKWIYDGDDIRTQEQDYYDADVKSYKYLSEVIDLSNLNDRVINFQRVYKITMTTTTYSPDGAKISTFTKAKPDCCHYNFGSRTLHKCPVCGGKGIVPNGFYQHTGEYWVSSTTAPEQCRSCQGRGYITTYD